jgi:hypothetical protein
MDVLWLQGIRENSAYMYKVFSSFVLYGVMSVIAVAEGYMYEYLIHDVN